MGCIKKRINPVVTDHVNRSFTADFTKMVVMAVFIAYTTSIIAGFRFEVYWKIILDYDSKGELRNIFMDVCKELGVAELALETTKM